MAFWQLVAFKQASHWGGAYAHRAKGECLALLVERRGLVGGGHRKGGIGTRMGRALKIQGARRGRCGATIHNRAARLRLRERGREPDAPQTRGQQLLKRGCFRVTTRTTGASDVTGYSYRHRLQRGIVKHDFATRLRAALFPFPDGKKGLLRRPRGLCHQNNMIARDATEPNTVPTYTY